MEAVVPSEAAVAVLRAISHAGYTYAESKALCDAAGWRLVDDEPELGYVRYEAKLTADATERRLFTVLLAGGGTRQLAFVPLFYVEEFEVSREPLDRAFAAIAQQLTESLGTPASTGSYSYPHRVGWPYSFVGWVLSDATLTLVQDEFDIQFGKDVTLWVQPAGTPVEVPVNCNDSA